MRKAAPVADQDAMARRLRALADLECRVRQELDDEIRVACENLRMTQCAVAIAVGVSETAIRKRKKRGWSRTGFIGRPR